MNTHTGENALGCVIGISISLDRLPLRILCVPGLLARNGISCGRAQFKKYYFGLLKSNLSIVRRLASLRLSGITVAEVVLYSPANIYVLARRFLCPVSCLLSHARNSTVSEESRSIYDSKASVHICIITQYVYIGIAMGGPAL